MPHDTQRRDPQQTDAALDPVHASDRIPGHRTGPEPDRESDAELVDATSGRELDPESGRAFDPEPDAAADEPLAGAEAPHTTRPEAMGDDQIVEGEELARQEDDVSPPPLDDLAEPEGFSPDPGRASEHGPGELASAGDLRARWDAVQMRFVDDPAATAAQAKALVTEAIDNLKATLARHERELASWDSSTSDTEELRQLVAKYRGLFETVIS